MDDDHIKQLERLADGETVDVDWAPLRKTIASRIRDNVNRIPEKAQPVLHKAAPIAPALREAQGENDPLNGSDRAADEAANANSVDDTARRDFFAARSAPADPAWPTHDTVLSGDALEKELATLSQLLDELDDPPVSAQRLAELVLERKPMPHTRSKYLAALRRVLQVAAATDIMEFSAPDIPPTPSWPTEPRRGSQVPPLSPIPFLQHEEGALGVPSGPVDEVDTVEGGEHGGVADTVRPLSSATDSPKDTSSKRQRSVEP
ncbi:hypothetical protein MCUN1_001489 [Malassezia cuniculi]|uniref:Uncharacterized protein n=1 Tax=Malassezia cuniculi TaxID=948313 RepID=A0AAF0J5W7_9BASI|nr:hypothetical protein MCUN1_001489 [Malassezia cuniculi]